MKNFIIILCVFTVNCCFSQDKILFSIHQIDSIASKNGSHGHAEGKIAVTENNEEAGKGGFSYNYFLYKPHEDRFKTLPLELRKNENPLKDKQLIKGRFSETIHYNIKESNRTQILQLELYYRNEKPFFVKITKITIRKDGNKITDIDEYDLTGKSSKKITPEIEKFIREKNDQILENYRK